MDAKILNLRALFSKDVRYAIPAFQRPYVWTQEDQWDPLWDDVRNTAERYLDALEENAGQRGPAEAGTKIHFLGAVVAQQQQTSTAEIETRWIIDGQQRLTTLQLLLDAAQEVFEHRDCGPQARRLQTLVLNNEVYIDGDDDLVFKVWPTTTDQAAFRQAMRNELPSQEYEDSRIVQAHEFFKEQIAEWLDEGGTLEERAGALEVALVGRLQMVVIDLEYGDDPHVIFETLNSRGTPLNASDLAKNLLMYETTQAGGDSTALHQKHLRHFEESWWQKDVRQGRIYRPRADVFLNYWLVMHRREEVPANDVFKVFRDHVAQYGAPEAIAADLHGIGETYNVLEKTDGNSVLGRFLYRWRVIQAGVVTPVLLWLLSHSESELDRPRLERNLRALESYLVRRMACRMTTKGYAQVTLALLGRLDANDPEQADETIVRYLGGQSSEAYLWPDDRLLEERFRHLPLYRLLTRARLRLLLEGVEEELRTEKAENPLAPRGLTIEHVMPQYWATHWPLGEDALEEEEASARRRNLVQSIGNLTLVNGKLNSAVSNGPWPDKRAGLEDHSVLYLNKDLLTHTDGQWNEASIEERAERLARVTGAVWPTADRI